MDFTYKSVRVVYISEKSGNICKSDNILSAESCGNFCGSGICIYVIYLTLVINTDSCNNGYIALFENL
jgi:hypothetical protein